jgi:hypothetical protein
MELNYGPVHYGAFVFSRNELGRLPTPAVPGGISRYGGGDVAAAVVDEQNDPAAAVPVIGVEFATLRFLTKLYAFSCI